MKEASHRQTHAVWFHLLETPGTAKFIKTESRMVAARVGGREREVLFSFAR